MNRHTNSLRALRRREGGIMHVHAGLSPTHTAALWLRPVLLKVGAAILLVFM